MMKWTKEMMKWRTDWPIHDIMIYMNKLASIKYVRAEGEGGSNIWLILRTTVLIGWGKCVQEGERVSKIPKILRTYLMDAPIEIHNISDKGSSVLEKIKTA